MNIPLTLSKTPTEPGVYIRRWKTGQYYQHELVRIDKCQDGCLEYVSSSSVYRFDYIGRGWSAQSNLDASYWSEKLNFTI